MDWYYLDELPIPKITQVVMRRLGLGFENEPNLLNVLSDFFFLSEDGYHQGRIDREILDYHHKSEKNRLNGKQGGRPKKTQPVILANQSESENNPNQELLTKNQEPITNNQEKGSSKTILPAKRSAPVFIFPDQIPDQLAKDFSALRKSKKAPITQTAIDGIAKEADKAGITLQAALEMCCQRGWTGFKAEWVADSTRNGASGNGGYKTKGQRISENNRAAINEWLADSAKEIT